MDIPQEQLCFLVNEFFLSHLRRVYDLFEGDIECAMVLGEVGHYNVKEFAQKEVDLGSDEETFRSRLKGCNTQSISMSMGIPRETVRRKIKKLQKLGWIQKDDRGFLFITLAVTDQMQGFNGETVVEFLSLMRKLEKTC